eukprot:m.357326 g.357326  ORF g.357326 m.357326 type:complete len:54 (+) comp17792_c0_seq1:2200-2361(+)
MAVERRHSMHVSSDEIVLSAPFREHLMDGRCAVSCCYCLVDAFNVLSRRAHNT